MIDPRRLQTPCRIKMILIGFNVYGPLLSTTLKNPHIADTNKTTEITFIIIFKLICFFFLFQTKLFLWSSRGKHNCKKEGKIMLASNAIYSFGILQIISEIQIRSDFPRVQKN